MTWNFDPLTHRRAERRKEFLLENVLGISGGDSKGLPEAKLFPWNMSVAVKKEQGRLELNFVTQFKKIWRKS